jgi:hypothetical protein
MTLLEQRRAKRKAAQPEVERLVKRYGIRTIGGCLAKIRERGKVQKKVAALKRELSELERKS